MPSPKKKHLRLGNLKALKASENSPTFQMRALAPCSVHQIIRGAPAGSGHDDLHQRFWGVAEWIGESPSTRFFVERTRPQKGMHPSSIPFNLGMCFFLRGGLFYMGPEGLLLLFFFDSESCRHKLAMLGSSRKSQQVEFIILHSLNPVNPPTWWQWWWDEVICRMIQLLKCRNLNLSILMIFWTCFKWPLLGWPCLWIVPRGIGLNQIMGQFSSHWSLKE